LFDLLHELRYARVTSAPSAENGAVWYGQVKATKVLAREALDAINKQVAFGR